MITIGGDCVILVLYSVLSQFNLLVLGANPNPSVLDTAGDFAIMITVDMIRLNIWNPTWISWIAGS